MGKKAKLATLTLSLSSIGNTAMQSLAAAAAAAAKSPLNMLSFHFLFSFLFHFIDYCYWRTKCLQNVDREAPECSFH